jgi:hypothetical protein
LDTKVQPKVCELVSEGNFAVVKETFGGSDKHLNPHRAWALIRDRGELTADEASHLEYCRSCHDWLATFVDQARKSGFPISFEIPEYQLPERKKAA